MKEIKNAAMAKYTSFRAGGHARRLIVAENVQELLCILEELTVSGEPCVFLGNGSNTLFVDDFYEGTVLMLGEAFSGIEVLDADAAAARMDALVQIGMHGAEDGTYGAGIAGVPEAGGALRMAEGQAVRLPRGAANPQEDRASAGNKGSGASAYLYCGATALLSAASKVAAAHSLTGLEFAAGIPGSAGGAVYMNAGAYGGEVKQVLDSVLLATTENIWCAERDNDLSASACSVFNKQGQSASRTLKKVSADNLALSYRHSRLQESGEIVCGILFRLKRGNAQEIREKMQDFAARRTEKQPLNYPSAGSFFKRPPGQFTGKLIQDAGLRGFAVGGAQVSEKHCGFIINRGGATAGDIVTLMREVQAKVYEKSGVHLEPEVRLIRNRDEGSLHLTDQIRH